MSVGARQMARAYDRRRKDIIYRVPGSKRRRIRLPPVEPDKERLISLGDLDEELLPGITNEIPFIHIIPKLSWRAFSALASVCRNWDRAVRAGLHRYYDERVRSNSTETLAVVDLTLPDGSYALALYSVRDERFYYVPPPPCFRGFPLSSECVALVGKLYVLGGLNNSCMEPISKEVYVLDLVGERQWRQCASMRKRRKEFACVIMDGKIYVHGGTNGYDPVLSSEVYDPKLDSWSLLRDRWGIVRFQHRITVVGEELVLHGGMSYNRALLAHKQEASLLEFYNPVTKEYSIAYPFSTERAIVSGTQGEFYSISWQDIHTHHVDDDDDAIPHVRSISGENVLPPHVDVDHYVGGPFVVTVVEDELLAVVRFVDTETWLDGSYLVRSRGYSAENSGPISWEIARCSGKHNSPVIECMKCSIQL